MSEKKPRLASCPNCGSDKIVVNHILSRRLPWWYYCECDECHWCGKTKLGVHRAARSWAKEREVRDMGWIIKGYQPKERTKTDPPNCGSSVSKPSEHKES